MDSETARIEHLKMIQAIVERMGRNSFTIKAGALTLSAALLAATVGINQWIVSVLGMIPLITLWGLDAFFVRQERLFRSLFNSVRVGTPPEIGSSDYFSMDTTQITSGVDGIARIMFSRTLPCYYLILLVLLAAVSVVI